MCIYWHFKGEVEFCIVILSAQCACCLGDVLVQRKRDKFTNIKQMKVIEKLGVGGKYRGSGKARLEVGTPKFSSCMLRAFERKVMASVPLFQMHLARKGFKIAAAQACG